MLIQFIEKYENTSNALIFVAAVDLTFGTTTTHTHTKTNKNASKVSFICFNN